MLLIEKNEGITFFNLTLMFVKELVSFKYNC